jgi:hypothetical protein
LNAADFKVSNENLRSPGVLFFNTGEIRSSPEISDLPIGQGVPDLKLNDFVCYDEAQVKLRYAVFCEFNL